MIGGDTSVNKEGDGAMDVTDSRLNPVTNYRINPREFNAAIQQVNRFFKK